MINNCNGVQITHNQNKVGELMEWYIKVLKQYADFEGRARRKEYWMFT
jgi:hypothetical protein